jgi:hypothetical protein
MEDDLAKAWREIFEWEHKWKTSGRWLGDWNEDLIEDSENLTLELWFPVNGEMAVYRPNMEQDSTIAQIRKRLYPLAKPHGQCSDIVHLWPTWWANKRLNVQDIKNCPWVMMYEMKNINPPGLRPKWQVVGDRKKIDRWFAAKAKEFDNRRDADGGSVDYQKMVPCWKWGIGGYQFIR